MDIQKLTKEQAVIISGFTGILCGEFSDFHADVEKRLGRGVQTFEFGFKEFLAEVKRLYEADFIEMGTVSKEEAKAQAVPEWISVENTTPNKNGDYIVCIDGEPCSAFFKWVNDHWKEFKVGAGITGGNSWLVAYAFKRNTLDAITQTT